MTNPAGELLAEAVAEGRIELMWNIQVLPLGELTPIDSVPTPAIDSGPTAQIPAVEPEPAQAALSDPAPTR